MAVLGRVRGNRGELTAFPLSSKPQRYNELRRVFLFGEGAPFQVESVWHQKGLLVFKFLGIDSISDAEPLQGSEVRIPFDERLELPSGEFYQSDLVNCQVVERQSGNSLGLVTGWEDSGGAGLLQVSRNGEGELLIPFARSICVEIDTTARRIVVDLPEGLKELNQP